ncbi:MAG: radical SAM protein [Candidatus Thorarchaeota archaeon]
MKALCPTCGKLVDAREITNSDEIYLERECPEHGITKTHIADSAEYWKWSMKYNRPGSKPFRWSSEVKDGCPNDCGLCSNHKQHSCIAIAEITGQCNLRCPICFASAPYGDHVPFDQVVDMINSFVSYETNPEILQLSGGEPTLHPEIVEIIKYAKGLGIEDVVLSTNGLELLDETFSKDLADVEVVIYLQFDTFKSETSKILRGVDLVEKKEQIVENCAKYDLTTVLVPTIVKGINDNEIGALTNYALSKNHIFGINFQPLSFTGRVEPKGISSLSVHEILTHIEQQTLGTLKVEHFRPIPCPHPHCTAISYMIVDDENIIPMTELVDVDDYIDYAKDRTLVGKSTILDSAFESLFSTSAVPGTNKNLVSFCEACGMSVPEFLGKSVKTVAVHAFMDHNTYQLERAQKCCIHVIQPDGRMIPFCNLNLFDRYVRGGNTE